MVRCWKNMKNLATARKSAQCKSTCLRFGILCFAVFSWLNQMELHLDFMIPENGHNEFNELGKSRLMGVRAHKWLTIRKAEESPERSKSRFRRVRDWLTDADNRKRFASMGTAGVLSYGVVSNVNYIPLFSYAWYLVAVRTKVSPIHQWPAFLSTYATLYIFNNVLRPIKLVVIGFVTPRVERSFTWMMDKLGIGRKRAVLLVYVTLNTLAVLLMGVSVLAASCLAGVPIWWPAPRAGEIRQSCRFLHSCHVPILIIDLCASKCKL